MAENEFLENIENSRLLEIGHGSKSILHLIQEDPSNPTPPHLTPISPLPFGFPPNTFITETLDSYLNDVTNTSLYERLSCTPEVWEPVIKQTCLLTAHHLSTHPFQLAVRRHPITGALQDYYEECTEPPARREDCNEDVIALLKLDRPDQLMTHPPGFQTGLDTNTASTVGIQDMFSSVKVDFSWVELQEAENKSEELEAKDSVEFDTELDMVLKQAEENTPSVLKQTNKSISHKQPRKAYEYTIIEDSLSEIINYNELLPHPAMQFSFELDIFQKKAIMLLEQHESLFVAAHTSAGKTVVAEYAIALAKKHHKKAIYTSPIKALSNQKYRDFKDTFSDVGIITGDVQLEKTAQCLIMTTEILRSFLYRNDNIMSDVEWVIFDEVHYINDEERGVVWEEVLIMLPQDVRIVMLSATVPNAEDFAEWVGQTKRANIHVIKTLKRPVPLRHCIYTGNSSKTCDQQFTIAYNKGLSMVENVEGFKEANTVIKERLRHQVRQPDYNTQLKQDRNIWKSLIDSLNKEEKLPLIGFVFSRKKCDELAEMMANTVCLTTGSQRGSIHNFFTKSIARLNPCDRVLPQIVRMLFLLKKGVGVHHSGILPILKEIVELLYQRGVVKVLFATETFAIGVNMPARTVVFDSIVKFDGQNRRNLHPGEYIQMAGRAGRRGKDDQGFVIIIAKNELPDFSVFHEMMFGKPLTLSSKFRLRYSMILITLTSQSLSTEELIRKSFAESDTTKQESTIREEITELEKTLSSLPLITDPYCLDIVGYYKLCVTRADLNRRVIKTALEKGHRNTITSGRIMIVRIDKSKYTIGALMFVGLQNPTNLNPNIAQKRSYTLAILREKNYVFTPIGSDYIESYRRDFPLIFPENVDGLELIETDGIQIVAICQQMVKKFDSGTAKRVVEDVRRRKQPRNSRDPPENYTISLLEELKRILVSYSMGQVPTVTAKDLHISTLDFADLNHNLSQIEKNLETFPCENSPNFLELFSIAREKVNTQNQLKNAKYFLSNESLLLIPEYRKRLHVLQRLDYVDEGMIVQTKGKIGTGFSVNELLYTELIVSNFFQELTAQESVALLSCIIFHQNVEEPILNEKLKQGRDKLLEIAKCIVNCERECDLPVSDDDLLEQLNFGLVEVVYEWAMGKTFAEIMENTQVHEGIIVRCIQQLNEVCRNIREVAHTIMGTEELSDKMKLASDCIKRDIIFTGSLYIN
ncbi:Helicase SKI2W [Oopsacas minuta]|uniref:Helicase SKI2W n=1 Tax=Oopsacas minuta TaxID=111878 RepID=A0AAV7K633_9METZ|nr:Helicase SKI2W [Oopsacas minuta]